MTPERKWFEPNSKSKWRAQRGFLRRPPTVVIVFDQTNECPLIRGSVNVHIDRRRFGMAQLERDGIRARLAFMRRWMLTAVRCTLYGLRVRPHVASGRYG
jgi:hypothetical protein